MFYCAAKVIQSVRLPVLAVQAQRAAEDEKPREAEVSSVRDGHREEGATAKASAFGKEPWTNPEFADYYRSP